MSLKIKKLLSQLPPGSVQTLGEGHVYIGDVVVTGGVPITSPRRDRDGVNKHCSWHQRHGQPSARVASLYYTWMTAAGSPDPELFYEVD